MNGGKVNILQLSYLRTQPIKKKSYPKEASALSDDRWFKIIYKDSEIYPHTFKEDIRKVICNYFAKYVLVPSYPTALKVSKEYSVNSITADK
jgi:hypothetical protein